MHGALYVLGALSLRCVCRDTYSCVQHTHAITQSPRTGYMCVDFPPAARRDPGSHVPVDTAICINHTCSNLHTWAPIQINVDRCRYWHRGHMHTQTPQRLSDLLRIRQIHSCRCTRDRKKYTSSLKRHMWIDTCIQSCAVPDV